MISLIVPKQNLLLFIKRNFEYSYEGTKMQAPTQSHSDPIRPKRIYFRAGNTIVRVLDQKDNMSAFIRQAVLVYTQAGAPAVDLNSSTVPQLLDKVQMVFDSIYLWLSTHVPPEKKSVIFTCLETIDELVSKLVNMPSRFKDTDTTKAAYGGRKWRHYEFYTNIALLKIFTGVPNRSAFIRQAVHYYYNLQSITNVTKARTYAQGILSELRTVKSLSDDLTQYEIHPIDDEFAVLQHLIEEILGKFPH